MQARSSYLLPTRQRASTNSSVWSCFLFLFIIFLGAVIKGPHEFAVDQRVREIKARLQHRWEWQDQRHRKNAARNVKRASTHPQECVKRQKRLQPIVPAKGDEIVGSE